MKYKLHINLIYLGIVILATGCGSSGETPVDNDIPYTDINITSGFSSKYLNGKIFYRPENYQGNNFIETRSFTSESVSWDDSFFNNSGNNTYTIVSSNGIDGTIEYYDGVYNLYYNLHSVETDHVKVCYTYTGIDSVSNCDASQALSWYFNSATAENNYP